MNNFYLSLLHEDMHDKQGKIVTTSLTMIDLHDIARSCRTYNVNTTFIAHPSLALQKLARILKSHWETGFGSTYNIHRKEALGKVEIVNNLDQAITIIDSKTNKIPKIITTSALSDDFDNRIKFKDLKEKIHTDSDQPYLMLLGTGYGMSKKILDRADYFLEPVLGANKDYNHLSVRSAAAIMLDKLLGVN